MSFLESCGLKEVGLSKSCYLRAVLAYIKILRPINLLIISISQLLLYYFVFLPFIDRSNLSGIYIYLLVIDTVLIAAAGYVINDIIDYKADSLNKPHKLYIGAEISLTASKIYYFGLVLTGFLLASFLAYKVDEVPLIGIYPLMTILLFVYSKYWKGRPLLGNLVVSLFTVFVSGILMVAERSSIIELLQSHERNGFLFLFVIFGYMTFAFLTSMMRELVKDIEDIDGDKILGYKTLPILIGGKRSKNIASVYSFSIVLLLSFVGVLFVKISFLIGSLVIFLLLIPQSIFILYLCSKASKKSDFTKISKQVKVLMVLGLFAIVFLSRQFIQ